MGDRTVDVDDDRYTGTKVVLATGSYARTLPGLEIGGRIMTSKEALGWTTCRSASSCSAAASSGSSSPASGARFGAEVTVVEALPRLVAAEDEFASKLLERAFRKRKIGFKTGVRFTGATQTEDAVTVTLEDGSRWRPTCCWSPSAVARAPSDRVRGGRREMERGFVLTDERLRTNLDGVYAVGDIVPGLQLAHRGFAQGIFVAETSPG